ncbi:hypothetical protein BRARA_A02576 [Brassica rapa]|uniref:Uncharacterized protein n=1 Tax=Brassica campestris TaxID=3711 RepID=A0A398AQM1_BRACM|nr:hypothetical protein BRARA_A02576 [Brassica rapa]
MPQERSLSPTTAPRPRSQPTAITERNKRIVNPDTRLDCKRKKTLGSNKQNHRLHQTSLRAKTKSKLEAEPKLRQDEKSISDQGVVTHITGGNFAQNFITINGWLRDFLWAQASQVIQSYSSSLSAYGLFFLGAHSVWAFSFMFLFSGCGY